MPRFVILRHELPPESGRPSHWDLMLERDGTLRTWALETLPQPGRDVPADALPDHRIAYLDYEGPVSNNRGAVTRWDAGTYQVADETPDRLRLEFAGQKMTGSAVMSCAAPAGRWTFRLDSAPSARTSLDPRAP